MQRRALGNTDLVAMLTSHLLGLVADKAAFIGMLVYVFDASGETATAAASIVSIVPLMAMGPLVARLLGGPRPHRVRDLALLLQCVSLAATAAAAAADAGVVVVVGCATVAVAATTVFRPAVALLSPCVVRDATELSVANVWMAYLGSAATVLAPALATALLIAGGSTAVLAGAAVTAVLGLVASIPVGGLELARTTDDTETDDLTLRAAVRDLRSQPGTTAVMALGAAHYALLMIFGILAVILARDALELGDGGPGNLNLLYGGGGLIASLVATRVLRRRELSLPLAASLLTGGAAFVALAVWTEFAVALVAVPAIGLVRALLDDLTRVMLLRTTPPQHLGAAFATLQAATGLGGIVGAALVQVLLTIGGVDAALASIGVVLVALALAVWPAVRRADSATEIPTVEMALLRRRPVFAALPSPELEMVARSATRHTAAAGSVIVAEGEGGDEYHVIVEGDCTVHVASDHVRTLGRGDEFGTVALLARIPRTATITAVGDVTTLVVERDVFLATVTGSNRALDMAWSEMDGLRFADGVDPFARRAEGG